MVSKGIGLLIFCSLLALAHVMSSQQNQWPVDCVVSTEGRVVPTKILDGVVLETKNAVFVHSEATSDAALGVCGKSSCDNNLPKLLKGQYGEPVHAEFCGAKLSRVVFSGKEIFVALPKNDGSRTTNEVVMLIALLLLPVVYIGRGMYLIRK